MSVIAHFAKKGWNVVVALSLMANSFVLTQSVNAHIVQEDAPLQIGVSEMDYGSGWEGLSLPSARPVARLSEQLADQRPVLAERARVKVSVNPEIYIPGWTFANFI